MEQDGKDDNKSCQKTQVPLDKREMDTQSYDNPIQLSMKSMHDFVEQTFKEWDWLSADEFLQFMTETRRMRDNETDPSRYQSLSQYLGQCRQQRDYYVRRLQEEYLATTPGVVKGLQYIVPNNQKNKKRRLFQPDWREDIPVEGEKKFHALVEYDMYNDLENTIESRTEVVEVEKEWVEEYFSQDIIELVKRTEIHTNGSVVVPPGLHFRIQDSPITRICYIPPHTRETLDTEEFKKQNKRRKMKKRLREAQRFRTYETPGVHLRPRENRKVVKDTEDDDEESEDEPIPMRTIEVEEGWKAKLANNKQVYVEEENLRSSFGDEFVDMVKSMRQGFVDIPVGDYKKSTLHLYPNLCLRFAPRVQYKQTEGMDLCVPKSLASVLHSIGLKQEAKQINDLAERNQKLGVVDTFKTYHQRAVKIIPNWLQPSKMREKNFDWKNEVDQRVIFVGVLGTLDGNNSHAVTLHDKFIYDANESVAIPLTQAGLDYCSSDGKKRGTFVRFIRGYKYTYKGKTDFLTAKMRAVIHEIKSYEE